MLNRRTLRIKIMQTLFAYDQCKEADYLIALDHITEFFQPDLNSMKVQDKTLLKGQLTVALKQFEKKFQGQPVKETSDPKISEAVDEALSLHKKLTKKDFDYFRKNVVLEVEKINVYYLSALNLIPALVSVAGQDKKINHRNFAANPVVTAIRNNTDLKKETLRTGGSWDGQMEVVRGWFRDCVKPDKEFQEYCALESPDIDAHKAFTKHLLRKIILGETLINSYFEEEDLRWAEDHEIVRSMTDKTLKSLNEKAGVIEIQKLSPLKLHSKSSLESTRNRSKSFSFACSPDEKPIF